LDVLERLEPVSEHYASAPVADAFTWADGGTELGEGEWYLVAFRSVRRLDADEERLTRYDELAHQEAAGSPGFVAYFKGPCAPDRTCLSFCLWDSRMHARAAAAGPAHMRAVRLLDEMYDSYTLEFHRVTRTAGGPLVFELYDRPGSAEHTRVAEPGNQDAIEHPATLLRDLPPAIA
jgi:hypothetical protein